MIQGHTQVCIHLLNSVFLVYVPDTTVEKKSKHLLYFTQLRDSVFVTPAGSKKHKVILNKMKNRQNFKLFPENELQNVKKEQRSHRQLDSGANSASICYPEKSLHVFILEETTNRHFCLTSLWPDMSQLMRPPPIRAKTMGQPEGLAKTTGLAKGLL
jgi:hypothetical protein